MCDDSYCDSGANVNYGRGEIIFMTSVLAVGMVFGIDVKKL